MDAATAQQLSLQLEQIGWNHTISVVGKQRSVALNVSQIDGDGLLALFQMLAPGGTPLPNIVAALSGGGLVIS